MPHLTLVQPGDVVIGVSPSYSHPSVVRAVAQAGATLVDTAGLEPFAAALERESRVGLVVMTRLAVTYEMMPTAELHHVVQLAHDKGVRVYVDDAGGARVGPAIFDQPRTLQLGVDVVATGLDKYGTVGPRLGVMAGDKALVSRIRARAFEMGLEARPFLYPPRSALWSAQRLSGCKSWLIRRRKWRQLSGGAWRACAPDAGDCPAAGG